MFGTGKAEGFSRGSGRGWQRAWWLLATVVIASLLALWLAYHARASSPETVRRALPTAIAPGPHIPAYPEDLPGHGAASATGCDDLKVLVDRSHALPPGYKPTDLVPLRDFGVSTLGGDAQLRRGAANALAGLVSDASASGEELVVASAYRSYEDQGFSHARLVSIYGEDADRTSAPPGRSQHQLGTAVDFTNGAVDYEVHQGFGRTTASRWLRAHAHRYGFVLAYPPGEEAETGYRWEPWHYRYVGADNARRVGEDEHGLQGFLQQRGVPPKC